MVRTVVLILTFVRLLLVKGMDLNLPESDDETDTNSIRRILHGEKTDESNFRFMVRIVNNGSCTGSIIDKHWILTAFHCICGARCDIIEIYPAIWNDGEKVKPSECYGHEDYSEYYYEHDIALLKVEKDLLADQRARALNLPPPGTRYSPGVRAVIIGWGRTETNQRPQGLLHGEVHLASRETCTTRYWANHPECETIPHCGFNDLPLRIVCAVPESTMPSGICYGDSGGPIIADLNVIGISTILITPDAMCEVGAPSAFLSVVDYLPWIYKHINPSKDTSNFIVGPEHSLP